MSYTAEQLDWWATWLDLETVYAKAKFKTSKQIGFLETGVDRGDPTYSTQSTNYLHRGADRMEAGIYDLRLVQAIGKAAQNHLACAAIAKLLWEGNYKGFWAPYLDMQNEWRDRLEAEKVTPLAIGISAARKHLDQYGELQTLQDSGDKQAFYEKLTTMALPVSAAFIELATNIGWPQPGRPSELDTVEWDYTVARHTTN